MTGFSSLTDQSPETILQELETALPFAGPTSFLRAPMTKEARERDLVVVGVPFDHGATNRPGTRYGPRKLREQSPYAGAFQPVFPWETELTAKRRLIDFGDVAPFPGTGTVEMMLEMTQAVADSLFEVGARPLFLGGDHTIPFGPMRAAKKHFGEIVLIHLDSHQDSYPVSEFSGQPIYNHGCFAEGLVAEGCVDPSRSVQIYIRTVQPPASRGGYRIIDAVETASLTPEDLATEIKRTVGDAPTYLTFDIDAVDPAFAPGTGSPVPGGPNTGDVRRLLHALTGVNLIGADLVEVNPLYDPTETTSIAGALFAIDLLHLLDASPYKT